MRRGGRGRQKRRVAVKTAREAEAICEGEDGEWGEGGADGKNFPPVLEIFKNSCFFDAKIA